MLLLDSPCQWIQYIWDRNFDCSRWQEDPIGPIGLFFTLLSVIVLYVLGEAIYRGRISFASPLTKLVHQIKARGFLKLEAWEICLIGLPVGIYIFILCVAVRGWSTWNLLLLILPPVALFIYQQALIAERKDPHKDLPSDVRQKTTEELKAYNEKLELLNRTRTLRTGDGINIFNSAETMSEVESELSEALKQFPQFKKQLKRMAEVKMERLMEKL